MFETAERKSAAVMRAGFVAVAGRPNVGKSTLLNRLAADKVSIVSHRRQTTRSLVRAVVEADGARAVWLDTPGWQTQRAGGINRALNAAAEWASRAADVVVFVNAAASWTRADTALLAKVPAQTPLVGVINKIDLIADKNKLLPMMAAFAARRPLAALVPLSAKTGGGVDILRREVAALLPRQDKTKAPAEARPEANMADGDAKPDADADAADGIGEDKRAFFFAELLREKLFWHLGDELPYCAGVVTDSLESGGGVLKVAATIYVERESQKRIIIGGGGAMLKKLATAARLDMRRVTGGRVHLSVRVRVAGWRARPDLLRRMKIGGWQ